MDSGCMRFARVLACTLCALGLGACTAGQKSDIGGTLSGLNAGASVTVRDNAADMITLRENGPFEFPDFVEAGSTYHVVIVTQPAGQTCTVANGAGLLDGEAQPIDNVTISCVDTSTLGATPS
jgi:hypothetical protein